MSLLNEFIWGADSSARAMAERGLPSVVLLSMLVALLGHVVVGLLQLSAGWRLERNRGRGFALVALTAGLISITACYCLPSSVVLFAAGLFVLLDDGTKRFLSTTGRTP